MPKKVKDQPTIIIWLNVLYLTSPVLYLKTSQKTSFILKKIIFSVFITYMDMMTILVNTA